MSKLFRQKNSVLYILLSLFIILFGIFATANFLYTNQINDILLKWYISTTSSSSKEYFSKIRSIEKDFTELTYSLLNSNKTFLSYVSEKNLSDSTFSYANSVLHDKANDNNLDAIYIYNIKAGKFTATYTKSTQSPKNEHILQAIEEFQKGKKWNYIADNNPKNGNLFYTTKDFSGFYVVYSVPSGFLNYELEIKEHNVKDFAFFHDNEYIFDSSYTNSGIFAPNEFNDIKFTKYSDKEYYLSDASFYINNTDYRLSMISEYNRDSFNSWKLPIITGAIKLFIIIILIYLITMIIFYCISKKKLMYFNSLVKSSKTVISDTVAKIIQSGYTNTMQSELILNTSDYFSDFNFFICIMFKIDKMQVNKNKRTQTSDILKLLYVEIVSTLSRKYNINTAICEHDTITVLLSSKDSIISDLDADLKLIANNFNHQTQHTITMIISDEFYNYADIYEYLGELNNQKQYRFLYGYNSVIFFKNTYENNSIEYPKNTETALIQSIIRLEHNKSLQYANDFFSAIIESNSPGRAKEWICTLFFSIFRETQFLYNNSEYGFKFIKRIFQCETLDECAVILYEMLPDLELTCSISNNINTARFKQQVNEIIEKEFHNRDLNIAYIAEKMNITPAYWGQKFIKEFNLTFNSYLINYRINKSLDMLKNTNEKISEIAFKCGFSNGTYFTKAFRECKGITPSQYRTQKSHFDNNTPDA